MAKKRTLKKNITRISSDLLAANLLAKYALPGTDIEATNAIIEEILGMEEKALSHISFSYDRTERDFANAKEFRRARHQYYKEAYAKLVLDFNQQLQDIIKKMNAARLKEENTAVKTEAPQDEAPSADGEK